MSDATANLQLSRVAGFNGRQHLVGGPSFKDREYFYSASAEAMPLLIDRARRNPTVRHAAIA